MFDFCGPTKGARLIFPFYQIITLNIGSRLPVFWPLGGHKKTLKNENGRPNTNHRNRKQTHAAEMSVAPF